MNDTVTTDATTKTTGTATHTATDTATDDETHPVGRTEASASDHRYLAPDWATRRLANPIVSRLVELGVSVRGARELQVRGRATGEWRKVPVNPLEIDGTTFLVAPRGRTQWVRNLRVAGGGRLRLGRRVREFTAVEVDDADKLPVIREYLRIWGFEVGKFFEGLDADSTDDQIAEVASGFPVFRID